MHAFRDLAQKHVSKPTLVALLGAGFVSLSLSGLAFYRTFEATLAELEAEATPMPLLASALSARPVAKMPKTPPPSAKVPVRSLAFGEKSREVLELQKFLAWRGFWDADDEQTSYFGEATLKAVKKYQSAMKIEPAGIVGPVTREAWKRDVAKLSKVTE